MSITKFKGQPVQIAGEFVKAGAAAPDFELVKTDPVSYTHLDVYKRQVPTCSASACRRSA